MPHDSETPALSNSDPLTDRPGGPSARRDLTGITLGDFRVERLLGLGGMGEVYLAHQITLDRPVALKVLKPELLSNPTYLARFEKEALSAAKLNHPNIVHIYAFGEFDNLKYIAMEYVQGTNLKEYVVRKGPPDLPLALSIMRQAGAAVAAASEVSLIHRDIKPENLLLTRRGQIKVADFGLCRAPSSQKAMDLTQEGVTLGTPMYMSPEQVQGKELDPRSDLYSLGVTFYHMLAGIPPFTADSPLALALKHVREEPVSLAVRRPDLPTELVRIVMKLMAKAPADRYQSAEAMLQDLARARETILSDRAAPGATSTGATTSGPARTTLKEPGPSLRERLDQLRIGRPQVAALVLGSAALGALIGVSGRAEDLVGPGATGPSGPPGLWMADWAAVPAQPDVVSQYRQALFDTPTGDQVAAWLAVPGRFPEASGWAEQAYTQLVRELLRRGDADRLEVLASELDRSALPTRAVLASIARAAAAALRSQPERVLAELESLNVAAQEPALTEIGYEVVARARRHGGGGISASARLDTLQRELAETLQIQSLVNQGLIRLDGSD